MLNEIGNSYDNEEINLLNKKIREYNHARDKNKNKTFCLELLQEINHLQMKIKRLMVDATNKNLYVVILEFQGVGQELSQFNLPTAYDLLADNILTAKLSTAFGLPTHEQWQKFINSKLKRIFSTPNAHLSNLSPEIERLNRIKNSLRGTFSSEESMNYFYAVKSFRQKLLDKLVYELDEKTDLKKVRTLLSQVNGEIRVIQEMLPHHRNRNISEQSLVIQNLYRELHQLTAEQTDQLMIILRNPSTINPGPPSKDDLLALLPNLSGFNIQKLGGGNNLNWKLSNPENGIEFVFQAGIASDNQELMHTLGQSAVNEYLSPTLFTSVSSELPYTITLTHFYSGGDLRSERERKYSQASGEEVLNAATSRLTELTSICQSFLQQKIAYPDIKLTNFVTNHEGRIFIVDKKNLY